MFANRRPRATGGGAPYVLTTLLSLASVWRALLTRTILFSTRVRDGSNQTYEGSVLLFVLHLLPRCM